MSKQAQYCISIAGFDPSGGAGILADIKTFESHDVYGLGVCTAITYQHEDKFKGLDWLSTDKIIAQLDVLLEKYPVKHFKIGLIQNMDTLKDIVDHIRQKTKDAFIIWDPILKASTGFEFHKNPVLSIQDYGFDLITPNLEEIGPIGRPEVVAKTSAVFLKGGHAQDNATDMLFIGDNIIEYPSERIPGASKHGSGCVLSSSILANKTKGTTTQEACKKAKEYTAEFLISTDSLLGKHQLVITA